MQCEDLLAKYILHVRQCEGIDFLDRLNDHTGSDVAFTDEEVRELERLAARADD